MALTFEASRCVLAMLHHLRLFLVSRTTTSFKACALSEVHSIQQIPRAMTSML